MSNYKRQASMQTQFKRHVAYCEKKPVNASVYELSERLKDVSSLYKEFRELQDEIEGECEEEMIADQYALRSKIEDSYYFCVSTFQEEMDRIKQQQQPPVNPNVNQQNNNNADIKLPRIKLPQFSSSYKDWPSFKDLYVSLIHDNASLKNVQKFHYLKDNVHGEAANLIKSLHMTDNNYPEAWKRIKDRFEHKRFIVDSHLQSLFSQQRMTIEDPVALKNLIDNSTETIRSLQVLGIPVNQWDAILVYIVASKLDSETHKNWELKLKKDELPTFDSLAEFLESRWQSLEMITTSKQQHSSTPVRSQVNKVQQFNNTNQNKTVSTYSQRSSSAYKSNSVNPMNNNCNYCTTQGHTITSCGEYLALSFESKNNFIKSKSLCFNCLRPGHSLSSCKSKSSCLQCGKRHHTTIHRVSANQSNQITPANSQVTTINPGINASVVVNSSTNNTRVLLATATINVLMSSGETMAIRALIDLGSEHSIIQEKLAKQLGLLQRAKSIPIIGVGDTTVQEKTSLVKVSIASRIDPNFKLQVELCTMKTITAPLPTIPIENKVWPHLQGLRLADEQYNKSLPVQMLLGAEVFEEIVLNGLIKKVQDSPTAMNSSLGWLLFGKVNAQEYKSNQINVNCMQMCIKNEQLDRTLKSFWELEEVSTIRKLTVKEQQAEDMFQRYISRTSDGRYQVALLFDPEKSSKVLGTSRVAALQCLYGMEKRFKCNPVLKERYHDYIKNLINAKHIELVPANRMNIPSNQVFYLPHHAVLKESSLTTKLRVVFNASRKTTSGISLNDKLLVGPKVQEDLFSILVRWRMHFIGFIADIEKMFRQIKINEEHRDYQRLLWRFSTDGPVLEYRITTVIDGTASATFLATRTLLRAGEDGAIQYPEAAKVVNRDFYMDDVSSGSYSIQSAMQLQSDLINILREKGFILRKWFSNARELMESVPMENRHDPEALVELIDKSIKTLGVYWNQKQDCFEFKVVSFEVKKLTKREVLSDIAKLFDPIGWLSPTTIMAKMFLQTLWSVKELDWDHKLPEDKQSEWQDYRQQLSALEQIKIPRWIGTAEIVNIELHGFADASELAYAGVVYARVILSDNSIKVSLISGKTKVAPLKTISIPKLELSGCVLLSNLITKIK